MEYEIGAEFEKRVGNILSYVQKWYTNIGVLQQGDYIVSVSSQIGWGGYLYDNEVVEDYTGHYRKPQMIPKPETSKNVQIGEININLDLISEYKLNNPLIYANQFGPDQHMDILQ